MHRLMFLEYRQRMFIPFRKSQQLARLNHAPPHQHQPIELSGRREGEYKLSIPGGVPKQDMSASFKSKLPPLMTVNSGHRHTVAHALLVLQLLCAQSSSSTFVPFTGNRLDESRNKFVDHRQKFNAKPTSVTDNPYPFRR